MKDLSPQSQSYLRHYQKWLRLFPSAFREHYQAEMLQLFQDQLSDAERVNDPSVIREVYLNALADLPFAVLRERFTSPLKVPQNLEPIGKLTWRGFSLILLILLAISGIGASGSNTLIIALSGICLVAIAGGLTWRTWRFTGRLSLAIIILFLIGVCFFLAQTLLNTVGSFLSLTNNQYFGFYLSFILTFLPAYLLLGLFQLNSSHYARKLLKELSAEEALALRLANERKRRLALRIALVLILFIAIPNLIGLYDPPADIRALYPPEHNMSRQDNAYYALEAISLPQGLGYSDNTIETYAPWDTDAKNTDISKVVSTLVGGGTWDQKKVDNILESSNQTRQDFATATLLPGYQIPDLAVPGYGVNSSLQYVEEPNFSRYTDMANLVLLDAMSALKKGQLDLAIADTNTVLRYANLVDSSNHFLIMHLALVHMETQAVSLLSSISQNTLTPVQQSEINNALPKDKNIWNNAATSIRWEVLATTLQLPKLNKSDYFPTVGITLLPTYLFQPNRTIKVIQGSLPPILNRLNDTICPSALSSTTPQYGSSFKASDFIEYNGLGKGTARGLLTYANSPYTFKGDCQLIKNTSTLQSSLNSR